MELWYGHSQTPDWGKVATMELHAVGLIMIIAHGLWALGKMRDLLFLGLINFMDKIILEKFRIII